MTAHDPAIVAAVDRAVELLQAAAARAHAGRPFNGALFDAWEAIDALLIPVEEADHAARMAELHAAGWQPNRVDLGNVIFEDDDDTVAVVEAMIADHDPDDDPVA